MLEVAFIVFGAALAFGLGRGLKVPVMPLLIVMGLIFSASGALDDREVVGSMLEIGLTFLVFAAGLEMAPVRVRGKVGAVLQVGVVQFVALGGLALGILLLGGRSLEESLYVALAAAASSTLVVVRLLRQRRQIFEPLGALIIGVLLLQDVLIILGLVIVSGLPEGGAEVLQRVGGGALVLGLSALLYWRVMPVLLARYEHDDEIGLLIVVGTLFAMLGLASLVNVPIIVGAFGAGLSLSSFPTNALVRGLIGPLIDFFLALFFVALGAFLVLPTLEELLVGAGLVVMIWVVTPVVVVAVAERAGFTTSGAVEAGLLLAQTSEFSLVVALQGVSSGQLSEGTLTIISLVTVVTIGLAPWVSSKALVRLGIRLHPRPRAVEGAAEMEGHVVVIGLGVAGAMLMERLQDAGIGAVGLDYDPAEVSRLREQGYRVVWGDADDPRAMEALNLAGARAVIVTTGSVMHTQLVSEHISEDAQLWVNLMDDTRVEACEAAGARTVNYSRASSEKVVEWFESLADGARPEQPAEG
ncbi:cation:proton antiporter [Lujinxingia litoralis]|nr:cation:proton antiporter [Lujinxingia litoralis]